MKTQLILVTLCLLAFGQVYGHGELCKEDLDCNTDNGQRCQRFDKCKWGECVCAEGTVYNGGGYGGCSTPSKVGGSCNNGTQYCYDEGRSVHCTSGGTCACVVAANVADSSGESCVPVGLVLCKKENAACTFDAECCGSSGSTCKNSVCKCNDHLMWWEAARTCVHEKAMRDLKIDERCNLEYPSSSYIGTAERVCEKGLKCKTCPEHDSPLTNILYCRKASFNSAPVVQMSVLSVVALALFTMLA